MVGTSVPAKQRRSFWWWWWIRRLVVDWRWRSPLLLLCWLLCVLPEERHDADDADDAVHADEDGHGGLEHHRQVATVEIDQFVAEGHIVNFDPVGWSARLRRARG